MNGFCPSFCFNMRARDYGRRARIFLVRYELSVMWWTRTYLKGGDRFGRGGESNLCFFFFRDRSDGQWDSEFSRSQFSFFSALTRSTPIRSFFTPMFGPVLLDWPVQWSGQADMLCI